MKYMKPFKRNDVFVEYCLTWINGKDPEEMCSDRLTVLLKYIRIEGIKKFTIYAITKDDVKKLLMDIK